MSILDKCKNYNLIKWIIGFTFGVMWKRLLKGVNIPDCIKFLMGLLIIIIIYYLVCKIKSIRKDFR